MELPEWYQEVRIMPSTLREQIARKCIHCNGIFNDMCEAGVSYQSVRTTECIRERYPCFRYDTRETCDKREWPTEEYIQAELDKRDAALAKYSLAGPLVRWIRAEHKGENWSGIEACPACGGRMYISHAGSSGHVWVQCETPDCLAFIE